MKKYYEFHISNGDSFTDFESFEKFKELKLPGNFWGWLGGKFICLIMNSTVKSGKKNWDKKILKDSNELQNIPIFPGFHLVKVYEEPNHIMREMK